MLYLVTSALFCCSPVIAHNDKAAVEDPNITLIDDCNVPEYMADLNDRLEYKIPTSWKGSKDWALTSFVIKRNGSLEAIHLCNSTGNKQFDSTALAALHSTKLPPLPSNCPDKVKATHAFGYKRAWKNSSDSSSNEQKDVANKTPFREELRKTYKKLGQEPEEKHLANLEALCNIAINLCEIFAICFFFRGGALLFPFLAAGMVWYAHRLIFGRFPS